MARNEEKAQSMLNRFITHKEQEKKKPKERRPFLASECRDLADADKWRQQILREIGRKVAEIQNEGLGEHLLRDLNDEINKLIREKTHWERRIVELGGHNYAKHAPKMTDLEGNIVDRIDASYYGYRDEEDGILGKVEVPSEKKMRLMTVEEWRRMEEIRKEARKGATEVVSVGVVPAAQEVLFEEEEDVVIEERMKEKELEEKEKQREFVVHVPLPDEKEIEKMVLEKKKKELLSKYASDSLVEEQTEAKSMLNIKR
ncbi:Pre-mRNA-splicing factor ISY1 homolog [Linum grandiflorum]